MRIYLKEKIGKPELFSGRKKELVLFQNWIEGIPREISRSYAILSRRKTGKTALMQRLYNVTYEQNNGVIPSFVDLDGKIGGPEGKWWGVKFNVPADSLAP